MKYLKRKSVFSLTLFDIGVLCCKILDTLGKLKKCIIFFKIYLYAMLLTKILGKSCGKKEFLVWEDSTLQVGDYVWLRQTEAVIRLLLRFGHFYV